MKMLKWGLLLMLIPALTGCATMQGSGGQDTSDPFPSRSPSASMSAIMRQQNPALGPPDGSGESLSDWMEDTQAWQQAKDEQQQQEQQQEQAQQQEEQALQQTIQQLQQAVQ